MEATDSASYDNATVEVPLPDLPPTLVSNVSAKSHSGSSRHSPLGPLARLLESKLFPGNVGDIDFKYLNDKVSKRVGDYEPMASDVRHYQRETGLGTIVGFHVYPTARTPTEVVIFCHGNIRPSRYMNWFLEMLSDNRKRVVIARDFVGYDLSSRVTNQDGALEIAAIANDLAVYNWAIKQYPDADVIVGGRSIGTLGWINLLSLPKVKRAFGLVPFADPAGIVASIASPSFLAWIPGLEASVDSLSRSVCDHAFPRGCESDDLPLIKTVGFSALRTLENISIEQSGKEVLLFKASDDELVPATHARILVEKLQDISVEARVITLQGGHRALPGDEANKNIQTDLEIFLSGSWPSTEAH